jgi:hypothetical protein
LLSSSLGAVSLLLAASCARSGTQPFDPNAPADGGTFAPAGDGGRVVAQCADDNKDVFVIAEDRSFYSFHPPTLEFTSRGILSCPTGGATPTSMAVDREGYAWVRHSDGSVWQVDTRDLSCQLTTYKPQADAFAKFGMGFSTESAGGSAEVLYLSDSNGSGLARLDTKTLALTFVGAPTGPLAGTPSELTGTGDGKLYGFFVTSPAQVAELSKTTGDVVSAKPLPNVFAGTAWAFSFYGGDFFIYTSSDSGGSDVTKYSPATGAAQVVKPKIGFTIVGAGVSTCAPTSSPR